MTSLRMTSDLRRQLILGRRQTLLRPQWLCRHHDAKRRGGGGHFGGVVFKHFPSKRALRGNPGGGMRG